MKIDLNINFLISRIAQTASTDRKIFGGTYKTLFFFTNIADYFQIYGNGLYQAVGRDDEHTYFKTWNNSSFAGVEPQDIFKQLGAFINRIEIYGCGNDYQKTFSSFKTFLQWINVDPVDADIQFAEETEEKEEEKKPVVIIDNTTETKDSSSEKKEQAPALEEKDSETPLQKKPVVIIDNNITLTDNKPQEEQIVSTDTETVKED